MNKLYTLNIRKEETDITSDTMNYYGALRQAMYIAIKGSEIFSCFTDVTDAETGEVLVSVDDCGEITYMAEEEN